MPDKQAHYWRDHSDGVRCNVGPDAQQSLYKMIQSCLIYAATIAVGLLAFSPLLEQSPTRSSFAFLAILPLLWAALRRNQRDTATTALLLSCFAVWGTMSSEGPFVRSNLNESFLLLLTFMISVSVPSLALSADVSVRQRHEEHVNFVMRELSHRSKNILSVVQSMAMQVARQSDSFEDFLAGYSSRLCAFAETHDLLINGDWRGADIETSYEFTWRRSTMCVRTPLMSKDPS
jgi:hypothetical protein